MRRHTHAFLLAFLGSSFNASAGLVAHFDFEEGSGPLTASAVGGWSGPFTGDPQWELGNVAPVPSGSTAALVFDGTDDRIVTNYAGIAGSADRSVSFWVNTTNSGQNSGIVAWGDTTGNGHKWHIRINNNAGNGTVGGVRTEIDGSFEIGDVSLTDGSWHHVVSVYDAGGTFGSGQVRHYVDSILVGLGGSGSDTVLVDTFTGTALAGELAPMILGGRQQGALQSFDGMIDEVRVYDHALTQTEIDALFVPEPSSVTLIGLGLASLLLRRRRLL